ncbi:MAG: hypothetical protein JO322_03835 [Candidatus Eremiobacteraeota bacterium]|nr:hypothetical protein [Candidatus Eremiobacteraeota bacterium]
MEHTLIRLAETAAWLFVIIFIFAIVGVVATIRWIINLVTGTERAVETGVHNVEDHFTRH